VGAPLPRAGSGLRVVVSPRTRRVPRLRWWLLLAFTVFVAFFALTYSRVTLDRSAFVLEEIERQMEVEQSRYWELRLEAARLQAPERIVEAAEEMGMVYPDEVHTLEVPGVDAAGSDADDRWVDLKAILSARP
jgi:cell division protein FtsL